MPSGMFYETMPTKRQVWQEIYDHEKVEDISKLREFFDDFLKIYRSTDSIRAFVNEDVHLLDVLYRKAKEAGMMDEAEEFKEKCYRRIVEEIESAKERSYPLQITFILDNYDGSERLEQVLNKLKPNDRNIVMLDLIIHSTNSKNYSEISMDLLRKTYRALKMRKLMYALLGEKLGKYVEKFIVK